MRKKGQLALEQLMMAGLALAFATFTALLCLFSADRIDTRWFS